MADGIEIARAYITLIPSMKGSQKAITEAVVPEAEEAAEKGGESFGSKFSAIASKALLAGAAVVGAAVVGLTKSAVQSFASYEQNIGGIETLYGKAASKMKAYAADAYKTAGMSANQYMETSTSFAAAMVTSLGGDTKKAAEYANMAITDMSDNANKMGTDIGSITYAYQGFAKQNYTMLDNLKLGYGGTKTEMQRLLADAEKMPEAMGRKFDLNNYADVVEAIHVVQTNMGITGTTAKEAASTISGSFGMLQGAWDNLLAGLASNGANKLDVKPLIQNVIASAKTVMANLAPAIWAVIENIPSLFTELGAEIIATMQQAGKQIADSVNGWLDGFGAMGDVLRAAAVGIGVVVAAITAYNVAMGAWNAIQLVWQGITKAATAIQAAFNLIMMANPIMLVVAAIAALVAGLVYFFTQTETGKEIWANFTAFLGETWDAITGALSAAWNAITSFFTTTWKTITSGVSSAWNGIKTFFTGLWTAITTGVQTAWNAIVSWLTGLFTSYINGWKTAWNVLTSFFSGLWAGIQTGATNAWNGIVSFITGIPAKILAGLQALASLGTKAAGWFGGVLTSAKDKLGDVVDWVKDIPSKIVSALGNLGTKLVASGKALVNGFLDGIKAAWGNITGWVEQGMSNLRKLWPFSPAKIGPFSGRGYVTYSGKALTEDFAKSIAAGFPQIISTAESVMSGLEATLSTPLTVGATVNGFSATSAGVASVGGETLTIGSLSAELDGEDARIMREFVGMARRLGMGG